MAMKNHLAAPQETTDGLYMKFKWQVVVLFEFVAWMSMYIMFICLNTTTLQNNLTKIVIP